MKQVVLPERINKITLDFNKQEFFVDEIFSGEFFSFEEFVKKSESPCYYCGLEWSKEIQDRRNETIKDGLFSDVVIKCNGIDRIDSEVGYTSKNTVPCCKYCNTAKNTMTQQEFKRWIVRVYENFAT